MITPQRKVWASQELADKLTAYWRPRIEYTSAAAVAREVVHDLSTGPLDESTLADYDQPGPASIRIRVDDATWAQATQHARDAGISIHSAVRRRLIKLIETETRTT